MKYVFRPKRINDLASGKITRYYNTGLIYKTLAQNEGAQKEAFAALYEAWIRRVKGVDDAKRIRSKRSGIYRRKNGLTPSSCNITTIEPTNCRVLI